MYVHKPQLAGHGQSVGSLCLGSPAGGTPGLRAPLPAWRWYDSLSSGMFSCLSPQPSPPVLPLPYLSPGTNGKCLGGEKSPLPLSITLVQSALLGTEQSQGCS